jgi:hypothetical protein
MKAQKELSDWFRNEQAAMRAIADEIAALDISIDEDVYRLYDLTDEEIKIIECYE